MSPGARESRPWAGAASDLATSRITAESTARATRADRDALAAQLHRRAAATARLEPLTCGCADPWIFGCDGTEPADDRGLDAWCAAAEALLRLDLPPIVPRWALRALWRRGGADAALAEQLEQFSRCTT